MLNFQILDNGNLRVSAEDPKEFAEYVNEHADDMLTSYTPNSDQCFIENTESYWANGWGVCTADTLGQLSECLVVASEMTHEDDGTIVLHGKAWTNIHNYQIVNPIDAIIEDGYIDFLLWAEFDNEKFGEN